MSGSGAFERAAVVFTLCIHFVSSLRKLDRLTNCHDKDFEMKAFVFRTPTRVNHNDQTASLLRDINMKNSNSNRFVSVPEGDSV